MRPLIGILFLLTLHCLPCSAAVVTLFQIGTFNGNQSEFEAEGSGNNAQFYVHAGDYTSITNAPSGPGLNVSSPEPISADGIDGFPRALTQSRPLIDIFFQLTAEQVASPYLIFQTSLIQLGADSSHNMEFLFNGTSIWSQSNITSSTGMLTLEIPASDFTFNEGGNVITLRRTGGSGASQWIQFDAVLLQTPEPSQAALALLGLGALGLRRTRSPESRQKAWHVSRIQKHPR
jgi:MYXO-CTERM domain-containing protein